MSRYIDHKKLGRLYHGDKLKVKITDYKPTTLFEATLFISKDGYAYLLQNKISGSSPTEGTQGYDYGWVLEGWNGETNTRKDAFIVDIYKRADERTDGLRLKETGLTGNGTAEKPFNIPMPSHPKAPAPVYRAPPAPPVLSEHIAYRSPASQIIEVCRPVQPAMVSPYDPIVIRRSKRKIRVRTDI